MNPLGEIYSIHLFQSLSKGALLSFTLIRFGHFILIILEIIPLLVCFALCAAANLAGRIGTITWLRAFGN